MGILKKWDREVDRIDLTEGGLPTTGYFECNNEVSGAYIAKDLFTG
jgi:hypothetical protein